MRRATGARGAFPVLLAALALACGPGVPSTSPIAAAPSSSRAAASPTAAPIPSATILSRAARPCAYVPGGPVAEIPPRFVPSPPRPSVTATSVDRATTNRQLEVLNELWRVIDRNYVDPAATGDEWVAVRARYRQIVENGVADRDFYVLLQLMIEELSDEHSYVESPADIAEAAAAIEGQHDYVGIGVLAQEIEGGGAVVIVPWPDSPADRAGIRPHDLIVAADGQAPFYDAGATRLNRLRGEEGTTVTLTVQQPGGVPRDVVVTRGRIQGPTPIETCVIPGTRIAYVALFTLLDETIDDQLRTALETLEAEGLLDGLILDNRMNGGGFSTVLESILSLFVAGKVGEYRSPSETRPLDIEPVDIAGSQDFPIVVLVGIETASYGEILTGVLQAEGAKVVGELSWGNVETLHGYDLPDGGKAWIANETFEATRATYGPWEETGIVPDRIAPSRWDLFTEASDPALPVALELLGMP